MTQIVFVRCPVVDSWRGAGRCYQVPTDGELSSPRVNFMHDRILSFANTDVLYVRLMAVDECDRYKVLYAFILDCRPNASCRNRFLLGTAADASRPLADVLADAYDGCEVYMIASGKRLPDGLPIGQRLVIEAYMLQGLHIVSEWHKRGLLGSQVIRRSTSTAVLETRASTGVHRVLRPDEGWLWNTSTPFVAFVIDFYCIESNFAGPNSQLNFGGDAEYRLLVANYVYDVLKAFVLANDGCNVVNSIDDLVHALFALIGAKAAG